MSNKIFIDMTTNDRQTLAALEKVTARLDAMGQKMDQVEARSKKSADTSNQWVRSVTSLAASYVSVHGITQLITAELEKQAQMQQRALQTTLTAEDAFRRMKINFVADAGVRNESALETEVRRIAKSTGSEVRNVATAASTALSARGSISNADALKIVESAFQILPNDAETASTLSGRALDIAKFTGEKDPRALLGSLVNLQAGSRITNLEQLGSTAPQAIKAAVQSGSTFEQGSELFATLNQLMADEEGRNTRTAMIALVEQLKTFTPKGTATGRRGEKLSLGKDALTQLSGATSTEQRLAILQSNPELAEAFLASASFEKLASPSIEALVTGNPDALREYEMARSTVGDFGVARNAFRNKLAGLPGALTPVAEAERANISNLEERRIAEQGIEARAGAVRKILTETFADVDSPGLDSYNDPVFGIGFGTEDSALRSFDMGRKRGESPEYLGQVAIGSVLAPGASAFGGELSSQDRNLLIKQSEAIQKLADAAEKLANERAQEARSRQPFTVQPPVLQLNR